MSDKNKNAPSSNNKENLSKDEYLKLIDKLANHFEKARIGEYIELIQKPRRFMLLNFAAGVAKGFGFAVGFTILGAIMIYILQKMVVLNLPFISDIIAEMVKLVQLKLR